MALDISFEDNNVFNVQLRGGSQVSLDPRIGNLSDLTTTDQDTVVDAINEVDANCDTNTSDIAANTSAIGTLANLTTDAKTSLVAAINEVDSHEDTTAGKVSTLLAGVLRHDISQSLSSTHEEQAWANIGVEDGTNYIKFPDGTLIQWGIITVTNVAITSSWGSLYESALIQSGVIFPVEFISTPSVVAFANVSPTAWLENMGSDATKLGGYYLVRPTSSQSSSGSISWQAVGRWK